MSIAGVLVEVGRLYRARWPLLLVAALVVFGVIGVIDTLHLNEAEFEDFHGAATVLLILRALAGAASALLGEIFYSGIVAAVVTEDRRGESRSLRQVARSLPYGRLIAADLLFVLVVALGLLLLIVPGLVLVVWFCLVAAIVEDEDRGVIDAFRRSRSLVRKDPWRVAAVVLPVVLVTDALADGIQRAAVAALGDGLIPSWAGGTLGHLAAAPAVALALVVLYLDLTDYESVGGSEGAGAPPIRSDQRR